MTLKTLFFFILWVERMSFEIFLSINTSSFPFLNLFQENVLEDCRDKGHCPWVVSFFVGSGQHNFEHQFTASSHYTLCFNRKDISKEKLCGFSFNNELLHWLFPFLRLKCWIWEDRPEENDKEKFKTMSNLKCQNGS